MWIGQVVHPVSADVATTEHGPPVAPRFHYGGIAILKRQRDFGLRALGHDQLVILPGSRLRQTRGDRLGLTLEYAATIGWR